MHDLELSVKQKHFFFKVTKLTNAGFEFYQRISLSLSLLFQLNSRRLIPVILFRAQAYLALFILSRLPNLMG